MLPEGEGNTDAWHTPSQELSAGEVAGLFEHFYAKQRELTDLREIQKVWDEASDQYYFWLREMLVHQWAEDSGEADDPIHGAAALYKMRYGNRVARWRVRA